METLAGLTISRQAPDRTPMRVDSFTIAPFYFSFLFDYLRSFSIEIENPTDIEDFLHHHPSIPNNLYQLSEALKPFGESSNFSLKLDNREEEGLFYTSLLLNITTTEEVAIAASKLEEIERSWLFQLNDECIQFFSFSLRFKA